jgi:2-keto-4-pentenoate hydratase/2-oxohepta-3-ene-1,7-dioic acid hydratase in catechol pathway
MLEAMGLISSTTKKQSTIKVTSCDLALARVRGYELLIDYTERALCKKKKKKEKELK